MNMRTFKHPRDFITGVIQSVNNELLHPGLKDKEKIQLLIDDSAILMALLNRVEVRTISDQENCQVESLLEAMFEDICRKIPAYISSNQQKEIISLMRAYSRLIFSLDFAGDCSALKVSTMLIHCKNRAMQVNSMPGDIKNNPAINLFLCEVDKILQKLEPMIN